jgi:hypothetical protein
MRLKIKKIYKERRELEYLLGTSLVFIFIFAAFLLVIKALVSGFANTQFLGATVITSFAGAFFAFLFVRIEGAFEKIYKRQTIHYNALVKIEHDSNRLFGAIHQKIFVIEGFLEMVEEIKTKQVPLVWTNKFKPLMYDKTVLLELSNIDFINQLFGFYSEVEKFNDTLETLQYTYDQYASTFTAKLLDKDWFILRTLELENTFFTIKAFAEKLVEENKEIYCLSKVLLREKPFLTIIMGFYVKKKINEKDKDEAEKEKDILEEQIKKSETESRERINQVLVSVKKK